MPVSVSDDTPSPLLLLLPLLSRFLTPPAHLSARLTKTQLLIVTALSYHESFHMSQLAAYLSFSKEQATRAAAPLVEAGLVERFAQSENRTRVFLRLTADGKLRPCLFSDVEYDLRTALREGTEEDQRAVFLQALGAKPDEHHDKVGTERGMSQIGG